MRIAHLTDLHVQCAPTVQDMQFKRILGTANLYLFGRRGHFSKQAQQAAVQAVLDLRVDLVVVTGDLTAQGLPAEFAEAADLLRPLAAEVPLRVIPGNHDVYVSETSPAAEMRRHFGPWMPATFPSVERLGDILLLRLETCAPSWLSQGHTDLAQLSEASALLASFPDTTPALLALHYPLVNRHGTLYGPARRANPQAQQIIDWAKTQTQIQCILHGHEHHGFKQTISRESGEILVLNPGASGYAYLPQQGRTAHFNVLTVQDGRIAEVERRTFSGTTFVPEPGGAYASGR